MSFKIYIAAKKPCIELLKAHFSLFFSPG